MAIIARGFTLIEMLVALSLLALVSALAYQGMHTVLTTQSHSQVHQERLGALQVALSVLERDVAQLIEVPARDEYGQALPVFSLQRTPAGIELNGIATGFEHSAPLRRVRWQISSQGLARSLWPGLDGLAEDTAYTRHFALPLAIEQTHSQVLRNEQGVWQASQIWSPEQPLPTLFELVLEVEGLGPVRRLLKVGP